MARYAFPLLVAFIAMAVWGLTPLHHDTQAHAPNCLASALRPNSCGNEYDSLAFLGFHIKTFQTFSLAPSFFLFASMLFAAFAARNSSRLASFSERGNETLRNDYEYSAIFREPKRLNPLIAVRQWITLHETRDRRFERVHGFGT